MVRPLSAFFFHHHRPSSSCLPLFLLSLVLGSLRVSADDLDPVNSRLALPLLIQKMRTADETPGEAQRLRGLIVQGSTDEAGGGRGPRLFHPLQREVPADAEEELDGFVVGRNDDIGLAALGNIISQRKRSNGMASRFELYDEKRSKRNYCCSTDMFCFVCNR